MTVRSAHYVMHHLGKDEFRPQHNLKFHGQKFSMEGKITNLRQKQIGNYVVFEMVLLGAYLPHTLETTLIEIFASKTVPKFIILPGYQGTFSCLVVFHIHGSRVPVFFEVLFKVRLNQCF